MLTKKISELDVIEFLTERREKLAIELQSIETTIAGLKSQNEAQAGIDLGQFDKQPAAVTKNGKTPAPKPDLPTEYRATDSIDRRILFVLSTLDAANRDEILEEIKNKYEPEADFEKLNANIKVRLSHLLKKGVIKGKRRGRLYTYSL